MSDVKQVKVDNWGIYFLQRLKHFFNRTDYCDLTLQFQDNAQLKVHRLVLNVCTEYFELLERTCEMYEDCLVMPDDLQADVVVPIVNFMYTGQLEFRKDTLDKLYQTSQVMNMPVLTKLLEAHRGNQPKIAPAQSYGSIKKMIKSIDAVKPTRYSAPIPSSSGKRSYTKAFESNKSFSKSKTVESIRPTVSSHTPSEMSKNRILTQNKPYTKEKKKSTSIQPPSPITLDSELYSKKYSLSDPRPTRYELPEELDTDNIFENSFSNISYASKPLMIHPDTTKQYSSKKNILYNEASTSKKKIRGSSTVDIVECKKIAHDNYFDIDSGPNIHDDEMFQPAFITVRDESNRDPSQLFDQILDNNESPKLTIDSKDKHSGNLDHAKIISEVLKKYPHLVKGNKNIKLKILNASNKVNKKPRPITPQLEEKFDIQPKSENYCTYETDVLDSKEAAKLIAMGAENIKGPWICLICGTPGRALNFTSYYNFRRHLVEIHNEKPVSTICEYCGLRSYKRNYLLHHIYTKHGVPPPPQYHFPKCNMCDYIALTEGFLVKHKLTHSDYRPLRCHVCSCAFSSPSQLVSHVQKTGHKVNTNKKENLQCVYCMKVFLRESNFYVHLKTNHKEAAIRDGRLIEDSDEDRQIEEKPVGSHDIEKPNLKYEHSAFENEYEESDSQYAICPKSDGNIGKKSRICASNIKHKILNPGFSSPVKLATKQKANSNVNNEFVQNIDNPSPQTNEDNIIIIDGNEYIMKYNQLIPKKYGNKESEDFIMSDYMESEPERKLPTLEDKFTSTTSAEFTDSETTVQPAKMLAKKSTSNQPIQIVVSNEEEYKALMSSSHSIIFDDSDTNKTLTVLTAPHTSIDNPGIDLDNSQSNEMMIVQEDYPLNVSETVSNNSKYVVVYSHAMGHDDPSKQYQIITPQEIGAEYVEASEVITENYENITTSVLNSHVIDTQIEESWPEQNTDVQATVELIPKDKDMEIVDQNVEHISNDNEPAIDELPEVQTNLKTAEVPNDMVTLKQIENTVTEPNTITMENVQKDQVIVEEMQNNTTELMDVDISSEVTTEGENVIREETESSISEEVINNPNEEALQDVVNPEIQKQILLEGEQSTGGVINSPEEINNGQNTEVLTDIAEIVTHNDTNTTTKIASDPIQNITSEWSEDECETVLEKTATEKSTSETQNQARDESEVEESIENIQQEIQKQNSYANKEMTTNDSQETHLSTAVKNSENDQNAVAIVNIEAAQEKISSLLNDWEDNDSQEDNTSREDNVSANDNGEDVQPTVESGETSKTDEKGIEVCNKTDPKKDDNIKSLVSDWDDDEEEDIKQ